MFFLEFVEGINQISDFVIDIRNELLDLTLGVKDLDRLCVRVIADSKWPWNCCSKVTEIITNLMLLFILLSVTHIIFCLASSKLSVT